MMPRTLADALEDAAGSEAGFWHLDERGDGPFIPYAELLRRARAIAGGLRDRGIGPGDGVAVAAGETAVFVEALCGALLAGSTVTAMPEATVLRDAEGYADHLARLVEGARVQVLIADGRTRAAWLARSGGEGRGPRVLAAEGLPTGAFRPHPSAVDDDALVQLTSGATGRPRGVVVSYRGLDANIRGIHEALAIDSRNDVGVSWLPLHHDMGLVGMALTSIYAAAPCALLHPLAFVRRPLVWLKVLARYRGTVSFAPSTGYDMVVRRLRGREPEPMDLRRWRVAGCGAEPVDAGILERFADVLAPCGFQRRALTPSYGLAEHVLAATIARPGSGLRVDRVSRDALANLQVARPARAEDPAPRRVVSCGRPLPGHMVEIHDDAGRPVPDRVVGQVVLRGASVMRGYRVDAGTVEAPADGLLQTGDLGYLVDGDLHVCGRSKETIVRAGRKFDPHDIERAVSDLPPLRGAAVVAFGTTPFDAAERVVVALELSARADGELADLVRRTVLDRHALAVDDVLVLPPRTLPHTTSGKPRRLALRECYERGELAAFAAGAE